MKTKYRIVEKMKYNEEKDGNYKWFLPQKRIFFTWFDLPLMGRTIEIAESEIEKDKLNRQNKVVKEL